MTQPAIRAVWSDFGGVLTPPTDVTMTEFCEPIGVPVDTFKAAMKAVGQAHGTDSMGALDIPLLTEEQWTAEMTEVLAEQHGLTVDLSNFADRWFAGRATNQPWIARLRRARQDGLFVGMLSNMVPSWDAHWRRMIPPEGLFDDLVMSFEVGCRKPDPEIFALAAKRAGVAPEECLLVDDLAKNCAGAAAAGWQAVVFTEDTDAAISAVDDLLAAGLAATR